MGETINDWQNLKIQLYEKGRLLKKLGFVEIVKNKEFYCEISKDRYLFIEYKGIDLINGQHFKVYDLTLNIRTGTNTIEKYLCRRKTFDVVYKRAKSYQYYLIEYFDRRRRF